MCSLQRLILFKLKGGRSCKYTSVFKCDQEDIKKYIYYVVSVKNSLAHDRKGRSGGFGPGSQWQERQNLGRHSRLVGVQKPVGTAHTETGGGTSR